MPARRSGAELPASGEGCSAGMNMRRVLSETVREWTAQWLEEGRFEGRAEGRAEGKVKGRSGGRAEVVCRMAVRKFDAAMAERLAGRLAEIADPERMVEVGEWIIECEDGDALLERVARLCGNPTVASSSDPATAG